MDQKEAEDLVRAVVRGLAASMKGLVERIEALEARPTLKYAGVWDEKQTYEVGEFVTHSGCLWHSNQPNNSIRPGTGIGRAWSLAVKAGRNAR